MKNAYTLLGLMFLVVFVGAYVLFERAEAPTTENKELILQESKTPTPMTLSLTSPAFEDGGLIPSKYTCDGENINPELHIEGVPEGTKSLVLVMDDPDIPDAVKESRGIEKFDHWVLYNIDPATTVIPEGAPVGSLGKNSRGEEAYTGACPPDREHRYIFRLYALSGKLNFIAAPTLEEVETAAKSMSLGEAVLVSHYERTGGE